MDATASARNRGGRAVLWDRELLTACRRTTLLRTAKSCGPDAPTLASSFAETFQARPGPTCANIREATVAKQPVTGEITKETVKTIARGKPD